ncbi:MAG: NADH-quinone oxidoreductase subunit NuoK [Candidatus Dormibacteraeota bacterium]|nr:NADH-quinone oxidoreductase subunit NuoK [Candidatus Dormibacteraeota bacterium]
MNVGPGHYAVLSAVVFALGLYGVLVRSNMLGVLIAVFLLFSAPVIALVGFSHIGGGAPPLGEALALFGVVAAAAQLATAIGITLLVWRRIGSGEVDDLMEADE